MIRSGALARGSEESKSGRIGWGIRRVGGWFYDWWPELGEGWFGRVLKCGRQSCFGNPYNIVSLYKSVSSCLYVVIYDLRDFQTSSKNPRLTLYHTRYRALNTLYSIPSCANNSLSLALFYSWRGHRCCGSSDALNRWSMPQSHVSTSPPMCLLYPYLLYSTRWYTYYYAWSCPTVRLLFVGWDMGTRSGASNRMRRNAKRIICWPGGATQTHTSQRITHVCNAICTDNKEKETKITHDVCTLSLKTTNQGSTSLKSNALAVVYLNLSQCKDINILL